MEEFFAFDPNLNGSKGLVLIGDKLLVYRRDSNTDKYPLYIDLPGGGAEHGETPFETFQREVEEEFGLRISRNDVTYVRKYQSLVDKTQTAYFPVVQLPQESEQAIQFGQEGLEYSLVSMQDFSHASDVWPSLQQKAKEYYESLNSKDKTNK